MCSWKKQGLSTLVWSIVADGLIIGSYFKDHGLWKNGIDVGRVQDIMKARDTLFTAV